MKQTHVLSIFLSTSLFTTCAVAQPLTEVVNKRLYEHHSSAVNNGANFGNGANGSKSGYDFVAHTYYNSFDPNTCCPSAPYSNGQEVNIDMVEHNGPFGNGGQFGFTSATSTIWGGVIFGNSSTRWMPAPSGFNYAAIANVSDIANVFNSGTSTFAIGAVQQNTVYLGKIRGGNRYVAVRCYNVSNVTGQTSGQANVSFDFDYKWGILAAGVEELSAAEIAVYPNPATADHITIEHLAAGNFESAAMYTADGQLTNVFSLSSKKETLDIASLKSGIYFLRIQASDAMPVTYRIVKE